MAHFVALAEANAIISAAAALFGSLIGVSGALLVQRYLVAATRVRERYKSLRGAYATFVAAQHTWVSLCKNSYINSLGTEGAAHNLVFPIDEQLASVVPEELHETVAAHVQTASQRDLDHRREQQNALNERFGDVAEEIHRTFVQLFMLDPSSRRKEEVRRRYHLARNVPDAYRAAIKDKSERANVAIISKTVLEDRGLACPNRCGVRPRRRAGA
jgi:hypothetical protein